MPHRPTGVVYALELGLLVNVMKIQLDGFPKPGFADTPNVATERVGQFPAAATDLHHLTPWQPIVVIGEGGQVSGVALHREANDLVLAFALHPESKTSKPTEREEIVYGDVTACAFAELDGIEEHG